MHIKHINAFYVLITCKIDLEIYISFDLLKYFQKFLSEYQPRPILSWNIF